jgi:hypothetical protein
VIDLTYDVVHGADPRERQAGDPYTFDGEHARDLVADLRRRERAAGSTESV